MGELAIDRMLACCCKHAVQLRPQLHSRSAFMVSNLVSAHNNSLSGVQNRQHDTIRESFVKGRGPGGQKINKARNCVQLTHQPTGVQVQDSRSLTVNRGVAKRHLKHKIKQHEARELEK